MSFKDNFLKSLQELSNSGRSSGGAEGSGGNGANNAVVASSPYANKFLTSLQEIQASEGAKKTRIESVNSFLKESGKTISGSKSGQLKVKPYRFKELRKQGGAILDYLKDNHLDASDELKKQLEEQLDELDKIISGFDWSERTDRLQEAREKIDGGQDGGTGRYRDLKRVTTIMDLYDEYGRVYGYDDDGKVIVPSYTVDLEHALQESGLGDYIGMSREEIEQEKVWLGYVDKYTGKQYKDTFWGNAKANYDMGRMGQDSSLAWNEYLDNPTEENRRKAETIDQLISEVAINNQEVYGDDGKFPWLSKSMANYLPQFFDQTGYSIGGGLLGLGVGRLVGNPKLGAKAGITAASGVYSYKTMQGAAFKRLMEAGYSEEVSAAAAHDEAVISSAIEMVDTAIDFATRFAGEGVNMLASGSLSAVKDMLAKTAGKNAFTRFATALGKYGINVEGERVEEILQELISIANETNPGQGKLQLIQDAFQIGMDILAGNDPENRERVGEAGDEGKKIAMMMGGADAAVGITVKGAARAGINSEYNRTYTQEQRQNIQNSLVEEGLKVAPDSQEVKNAKNRLDKGKDLTGVQVRELVDVNEQAIQTQAVKQRLEAMGESGNTDSIATAIVKKNRGEELSSGDRYAMSTSSIGDVVLRELASGEIWDHVADENKTTLESISQKYGTQAKAVEKIYEMGGGEQDPEKFDRAYEFAYNLGKNGGKWEYAKNSTATSYLTEQQREFAYNAGKYAGEKENQSIQVASQQGVETQMNPLTAPAATEGGGVAANMNMEGMNNGTGEEVHLRQGVQRNDGTNSGGQVRTVEAAAGGVQNRQGEAQGRSGNGGGSQKAAAGRVSTADLGFDRGNQTKNLTLVPATEKSRTLDGARAVAKKHGMDIVLFRGGNLEMKDQNGKTITARACVRGNTMYVRADHKGFSPEQLARHEAGHKQIERGEISPKQVYDKLATIYRDTIEENLPDGTTVTKSQCIDYMIEQYAIAYQLTDMTSEEVWEEIVCDSLADMNAFSPETARQAVYFLEDTKNVAQMQREETKAQRTGPPDIVKYSIDPAYAAEIDMWDKNGRPDGEMFVLGSTGGVLQGLGAMEQDIFLRSEKVNTIMREHPEMTLEEIRRIPEILDDPTLVLKSQGKKSKGNNSRLVMFGSVYTQAKQPVLSVLDLRPMENGISIDDMQKVSSSYVKTSHPDTFVQNSDVLYADKKRTIQLLRSIGLTISSRELLPDGYIGNITYSGKKVNINGIPFREAFSGKYGSRFSRENPTAAELQRENTLLRQRLEYWMGQTKLTERKTVRLADVDKVAKDTLAKYQSEADFGKVRNAMKYLADDMRNLDTASITGFDMDALSAEDIFADMRESPVWDKLQTRAEGIAETILDGSKVQTNEETTGFVKDLRGFLKGRKISLGENKSDISDYNDFRKRNFGRFTLSDSGTPMDTVWMELQAEFGKGFFPDDITHPADQALHVEQWLNTAPEYANPYRADFRDNVGVLANEILDDLFSDAVRDTAPTFADRKASKLQEMERRLTESRNRNDSKLQEMERQLTESRKKISEIREEKNQMRKSYQESRAKSVDGRKKTVLRNQIKSLAEKFHQMAVAPQRANTRHAPVQLTNALYQFCDVFAESQERGAERRAQKDTRIANMAKKIKAMRDAYANLDQDGLLLYYNQHAEELVNKLSGELSGTDIYDMSREQLEAVHDTMKAMMHAIVNANNIDSMEKDMGLMETVKKFSSEIDQVSVNQKDVAVALRRYKMWQMSPDVFFDYICGYIKGNVGQDVQKMFSGGSERMISVQREFYNMFRPFTETENKQNAKALREMLENPMKHTVDWGLKDGAGNPVETSRGMMLQAYMLLKQEDSLNSIAVGGFKIPRMDAYYKGNIEAAYGDATESSLHSATMEESLWDINREIKGLKRELKKAGLKDEDARQMESRLKELEAERDSLVAGEKARLIAMRDAIYEKLTPMERELVQTADQWYRYSGELMGDVYEGMYGYRPHLVEDYVPIHRDMDSVKMDVRDVNGAFNLENAGFTKERVKSTAPILLTDFFTELNKQSDSISRYYGFAQAQKDFNRIWNMKVPGMSTTIKGKVGAKFGKGKTLFGVSGETYVENYIKAVSGANQGNDILSTFYGNAASATLSLNLRVAFSQLASIPTASAVVGWKSMAAGFSKGIGTSLSTARKNELAQKSAWFFQRYRGNGGITEIAELNAKGGLWAKASSSKVGKLLFNWCQNFDVFATASMWAMAEDYVQSHGMKANSEGYQAAVEQVYEDIIRKTQPNYTVTERSDLLRDKRGGMKLLTMYKTQSNQNLNILMGANGEFRRMKQDFKNGRNGVTEADVKAAGKRLLNAVTSVTIGGTLTFVALRTMVNFLMAAVNPYRDDDTDEVTLEETLKAMGKEMLSSLFGMYALGGQVYDLLSAVIFQDHYYGISDSAISLIADVVDTTVDTAKKLTDEDADAKEKWAQVEKELGAVLTAFGVPYNNAKKFLNAARQWYHDFENGTVWQFSREGTSDRQFHERFLRAFREGDMEKCGDVVAYLLVKSDAASDNEAKKYLRSGFKGYLKDQFVDGEVSAEEVRSVLSGYLDMDEEEVDEAITSWQGIVDTGNSLDEEKDLYLRKDISRKEYADYLVKYDGKKPEEADKFIKKVDFENEYHFSYSDRKDGYKKGKITANQLIQAMVDIDGKTREEARHTIAEYDWENAVPDSEGISWSAIQEYHEKAEPNGVSKRMYTKAWKIRNKTKGEDLDNDGKTDKDSKAKKVIRQIGELSISAEEKQAIAEVWWSKKTVNKYKTW